MSETPALRTSEALRRTCEVLARGQDAVRVCGALDTTTGAVLALCHSPRHARSDPEQLATRCLALLRDAAVPALDRLMRAHFVVADSERHTPRELHITSGDAFHFIKTTPDGSAAAIVVMDTTTVGMGWTYIEAVLQALRADASPFEDSGAPSANTDAPGRDSPTTAPSTLASPRAPTAA